MRSREIGGTDLENRLAFGALRVHAGILRDVMDESAHWRRRPSIRTQSSRIETDRSSNHSA